LKYSVFYGEFKNPKKNGKKKLTCPCVVLNRLFKSGKQPVVMVWPKSFSSKMACKKLMAFYSVSEPYLNPLLYF